MPTKSKRLHVLITGGAGFIGSHLADHLLAAGHRVTAVDDFSTGKRINVTHLCGNPRFRLKVASVLNKRIMESLVKHCDHIYHLAATVGVELVVKDPIQGIQNNIQIGRAHV